MWGYHFQLWRRVQQLRAQGLKAAIRGHLLVIDGGWISTPSSPPRHPRLPRSAGQRARPQSAAPPLANPFRCR